MTFHDTPRRLTAHDTPRHPRLLQLLTLPRCSTTPHDFPQHPRRLATPYNASWHPMTFHDTPRLLQLLTTPTPSDTPRLHTPSAPQPSACPVLRRQSARRTFPRRPRFRPSLRPSVIGPHTPIIGRHAPPPSFRLGSPLADLGNRIPDIRAETTGRLLEKRRYFSILQ